KHDYEKHPSNCYLLDTTPPDIYTLSLHDALPICRGLISSLALTRDREPDHNDRSAGQQDSPAIAHKTFDAAALSLQQTPETMQSDRKSTRLNSSHVASSYAVFCLKKKTKIALLSL